MLLMKKLAGLIFSFCFFSQMFAEENYDAKFVKGNIQDKIEAVEMSAAKGNTSLAEKGIDFALASQELLGDDEELNLLVEKSIESLSLDKTKRIKPELSQKLEVLFSTFKSEKIRLALLNAFSVFPNSGNVMLVNNYFNSQMQSNVAMDETLLNSILFLGANGNSKSFNLLFIADILDVWPTYSEILGNAYGPMVERHETELLQILSSVPVEKRVLILNRINSNSKISKKICGEVAENALSSVIYNKDVDVKKITHAEIELQMNSLQIIADTKWTRASTLATSFFSVARAEYENSLITGEQFSTVITNIASVASEETGQVLSAYLDLLNKRAEENNAPVEVVVLSVINSLGDLGDKAAFDYLLSVTYLNYPEEVTAAARTALAKLKW